MLEGVKSDNLKAWKSLSKNIAREMKREVRDPLISRLQARQVILIKSIPSDAAARAQKLSMQAAVGGKRAAEVAEEIARTNAVTESRAMLIARTEIARSNAVINQARAESVGSEGYIWRTADDADVRESHAEMEGEFVRWDDPPTLSDGMTGHAGEFPNCRCYAETVLPDLVGTNE